MLMTDFPDILPAFLDQLQTALASSSVTVAEDLTGYHSPESYVTIQFSGGTFLNNGRVASPRFDVNVYAKDKPTTMSVALKAVYAMSVMKNYVGTDFVVTDVDVTYPQDLSDPINHNPRMVFDVTVNYRKR